MPRIAARTWLLCAALATACSSPEEQFADHIAAAQTHAAQERTTEAILEYRAALRIEPEDAEANERIGELLRDTGGDGAATHLRDAFQLDPQRVDAAIGAARLVMLTDRALAAELLDGALRQDPKNADAYTAKSDLALLNNDSRRAIFAATQAVRLSRDSWETRFQLGKAYRARIRETLVRNRRPSEVTFRNAISAFEAAEELGGENPLIRLEIARVLGTKKEHSQAQSTFRDAMDLANGSGDRDAALAVAMSSVEYARSTNSYAFLGWALRSVVDLAPDHIGAWSRLATLEDTLGGDGLKVMEELIAKRPTDVAAQLLYTRYLVSRTKAEEAMRHLRGLIAEGSRASGYWEQIARIQIRRGKVENARATFEEMLLEHPDSRITRRTEIRLALAEERYDHAVQAATDLLAEGSRPELLRLLALAELKRGNLPEATAAIELAIPENAEGASEVVRLQARIQAANRDWPGALQTYRELRGRRVALPPAEQLLFAQTLYESNVPSEGRQILEIMMKRARLPVDAAVEYARRERRRDPEGSLAHLEAALTRNPLDADVLAELTRIDVERDQPARALARLDAALATGRGSPELVLVRAKLLARIGRLKRAERDAMRALEADPELTEAGGLLFSIFRARGDLESARTSYEQADAAGVLNDGALVLLGRLYEHAGDRAAARATYERVVAKRPSLLFAKARLAYLLAVDGPPLERAIALAEEARPITRDDDAVADAVGYVDLERGRLQAAASLFRTAIALAREDQVAVSEYHYHLGLALSGLARKREAADAFARALELDADFAQAEDARQKLEAMRADADVPSPS